MLRCLQAAGKQYSKLQAEVEGEGTPSEHKQRSESEAQGTPAEQAAAVSAAASGDAPDACPCDAAAADGDGDGGSDDDIDEDYVNPPPPAGSGDQLELGLYNIMLSAVLNRSDDDALLYLSWHKDPSLGADVQDMPPLIFRASGEGTANAVAMLLASGGAARINQMQTCLSSGTHVTPLQYATQKGRADAAAVLLAAGADPDGGESGPMASVLWPVAACLNEPYLRVYLAAGASPNVQDRVGQTPLFLLVRSCHGSVSDRGKAVRLLLQAGADPYIADECHKTFLAYADSATAVGVRFVLKQWQVRGRWCVVGVEAGGAGLRAQSVAGKGQVASGEC